MIRQDRIELNNRFREAFSLLEERGVIIKNDRGGKGIGDFAEKILGKRGYGHIVKAFLDKSNPRVIDYHQAKNICEYYNINESWLLEGKGQPFGFDLDDVYQNGGEAKQNIIFSSINAFAGSTIGADSFTREEFDHFSLPGLDNGNYVAFLIEGNSMEPIIADEDIVVCEEITNFDLIIDNDIYAIKSNGSFWVKYIQKIKTGTRITALKMISANYLEHDPFTEEVNEYTQVFKVLKKISDV